MQSHPSLSLAHKINLPVPLVCKHIAPIITLPREYPIKIHIPIRRPAALIIHLLHTLPRHPRIHVPRNIERLLSLHQIRRQRTEQLALEVVIDAGGVAAVGEEHGRDSQVVVQGAHALLLDVVELGHGLVWGVREGVGRGEHHGAKVGEGIVGAMLLDVVL